MLRKCKICNGTGGGNWPEPGPGAVCESCRGTGVEEEVVQMGNVPLVNDSPRPDAMDPGVLREEIINIICRPHLGVGTSRKKAEALTDDILLKLAQFYAATAQMVDVTQDAQAYTQVGAMNVAVGEMLRLGPAVCGCLDDGGYAKEANVWRARAARLRNAWNPLFERLTS